MWHYKCIRPILNDHRTWPQFLCPNCRAVADLEADVDDPYEFEEQSDDEANGSPVATGPGDLKPNTEHVFSIGIPDMTGVAQPSDSTPAQQDADPNGSEVDPTTRANMTNLETNEPPTFELDSSRSLLSRRNASSTSMLQCGLKAARSTPDQTPSSPRVSSSPGMSQEVDNTHQSELSNSLRVAMHTTGEPLGPESMMTPRNDAGPFVFDGSGGRAMGRRVVASLAEATAENEEGRPTTT